MPDDLLGPLADEPVPPLLPATLVRARGEQRTRRRRAVLAGAAAVVVLAAGVTLAGPGGDDELRPAPFATQAPAPADPLWAALLDPEDVGRVLGGSWDDLRGGESAFSDEVQGCPETHPRHFPSSARFLTDGQRVLGQSVALFDGVAEADERYQRLLELVRTCAEGSPAYRPVSPLDGASTRVLGHVLEDGEPPRVFSLERVGRAVVTVVGQGLSEPSPELADAAAAEVREVFGQPLPPRTPPAEPPAVFPAAFLTPEQAAEAESPGWGVVEPYEPQDEPLLDPCGDGTEPLADRVRESGERALQSEREAGGSSLVQEVFVHDDAAAAAAALREYETRVERCPTAAAPQAPDDHAIERSVVPVDDDRVLVRERYCGPQCTDLYTTWVLLARSGRLLSVARYAIGEDGDPQEWARPLLDATYAQLERARG